MNRKSKHEVSSATPTESEKRSSDALIEWAFKEVTREQDQQSFQMGFRIADVDMEAERLEKQARAKRAAGYKLREAFIKQQGGKLTPVKKRSAIVEERVQKIKAWLRNRGVVADQEIGKRPGSGGGWKAKCRTASQRWAITAMSEDQFDHAYKLALSDMKKEDAEG